ncbi:MAG: LCP family protein [Clostridium sp.]|nr:LCP family protein [Clostridium sp.]MCM1444402.1 LCP family protein [Candidatus Amulumruptor caecigallinarius]
MRKNKLKKYNLFIAIILSFLCILNFYFIFKLNVIPSKYLSLVYLLLILTVLIIIPLLKIKKKQKKLGMFLSFIATLFSIFYIILFLYIIKTYDVLGTISSNKYKTQNYIIVVNNNSNYNKIEDLKNKKISYVETEIYDIKGASNTLKTKIAFKENISGDYETLLNELYSNKVDAILLETSYKELLVSEANKESLYSTFDEKTKIIYNFEIQLEEEKQEKIELNVVKDSFNIYISGIDTYGKISSVSRSDVNIVASINPNTKKILLITIPRDYYVHLSGTNGYKDKLTHAGIYGVDKSLNTIEELLDIDINYYIKVNFTSLIKIVDAVDGVNVYSEYTFKGENYTFNKGYNYLNGEKALEFSRTRKTLPGGDRTRGKNQQAVITALVDKFTSKKIITNYSNILDSIKDTFVTNMTMEEITNLIKMQIDDMSKWDITSISLDGSDSYEYTYSYSHQKLYVMVPNNKTIEEAKLKINQVFN